MPQKAKFLVLGSIVLVLWVFFAPQPLGGRAAYVTTRGISMEPQYSQGDLVVVQRASSYEVGDIIAYKSGTLRTIVLHRVTDRERAGLVTKGDNNDWLDPDRVKDAEVIGKAWFHVPGAGKLLAPVRNPVVASAVAAAIGLTFLVGGRRISRRQRERRRGDRRSGDSLNLPRIGLESFTRSQKRSLTAIASIAALAAAIFAITLLRPPIKDLSSDSAYTHIGAFTYAADIEPNTVYPDGSVTTGEPIFTRVIDRITIGFDYRLETEAEAALNGYLSLSARVEGPSGWTKPVLIGNPIPFGGATARAEGELDLIEVNRVIRNVQRVTGIAESAHLIHVSPTVQLEGRLAGQHITDDFAPKLQMTLEPSQLKIAQDAGGSDPLTVRKPGRIKTSQLAANNFSFLGRDLSHGIVKNGSLLGIIVALLAAAAMWRRFSNPAHADEPALIAAQYSEWLVPVKTMRRDPQRSVHVQGFDALLRLAELYERMILHATNSGDHQYFIEEEGVVYYYETSDSKKGSSALPRPSDQGPPPPPPPPPLPRRLKETQDPERLRRLRAELTQIEQQIEAPGPGRPEE